MKALRLACALAALSLAAFQIASTNAAKDPITSIVVVVGSYFSSKPSCPEGHTRMEQDLVSGSLLPSESVYLCLSTNPSFGKVITSMMISQGPSGLAQCPPGYDQENVNLNRHAVGGFDRYLCTSTASEGSILGFSLVKGRDATCPEGFFRLEQDLNQGNGGTFNFLCVEGHIAIIPGMRRLAFAGDDGMNVGWTIPKLLLSSQVNAHYSPVVKYGTTSGDLNLEAIGEASETPEGAMFYATLPSLPASSEIFYVVGDEELGLSDESSFRTGPPAKSSSSPFSVFVLGDMGISNSANTMQHMLDHVEDVDFYIHLGDLSYADDRDVIGSNPKYEPVWNRWQAMVEAVTKRSAYMVLPGNHDITCHEWGDYGCPHYHRNYAAFNARLRMPSEQSNGVENLWYSFNYANVHFVSINTESDLPDAPSTPSTWAGPTGGGFGDQLAWLENDLREAQNHRDIRPWIVVMGHRPVYSSVTKDFPAEQSEKTRRVLEPVFMKWGVDLYLCGHVHGYERHFPVFQRKKQQDHYHDPQSPIYIVNGAAGDIEGHDKGFVDNPPNWVAYRNAVDYGYGILDVVDDYQLQFHFFRSTDGLVEDSVHIYQSRHGPRIDIQPLPFVDEASEA